MVVVVVPLFPVPHSPFPVPQNTRTKHIYEIRALRILDVADGSFLLGVCRRLAEPHRRPVVAVLDELKRMVALHRLVRRAGVHHHSVVRRELGVVLLVVVAGIELPADTRVRRKAVAARIEFHRDAIRVLVVAERRIERECDVVCRIHPAPRDKPARVRRVEERRDVRILRVALDVLRKRTWMRVAESNEPSVGEKIFSRGIKRRLQHRDFLHKVNPEIALRAIGKTGKVLERHLNGISGTLPPDSGLGVKALPREVANREVPHA